MKKEKLKMTEACGVCGGELWVCENHPRTAWGGGNGCECGGAGAPCVCNPLALPMPGKVRVLGAAPSRN